MLIKKRLAGDIIVVSSYLFVMNIITYTCYTKPALVTRFNKYDISLFHFEISKNIGIMLKGQRGEGKTNYVDYSIVHPLLNKNFKLHKLFLFSLYLCLCQVFL